MADLSKQLQEAVEISTDLVEKSDQFKTKKGRKHKSKTCTFFFKNMFKNS